jgi:hypothetical protein
MPGNSVGDGKIVRSFRTKVDDDVLQIEYPFSFRCNPLKHKGTNQIFVKIITQNSTLRPKRVLFVE